MNQGVPRWMYLVFVGVGLTIVLSLGMTLAFVVGGIDSRIPAAVVGPILCPPDTQARAPYVRSFGGVSGPLLVCEDAERATVATFRERFLLLWDGLFVLPLLPLVYPIVVGLRRHQYGTVQKRTSDGRVGGSTVVQARVYSNPAEMPPEARQAFQELMSAFTDADRDGVPDIFAGDNVQVIDLHAGTATSQDDPLQKLHQLKEMLDAGLITQQEYDVKKAEILSKF